MTDILTRDQIEYGLRGFAAGDKLDAWLQYFDEYWTDDIDTGNVMTFFLHSWDHEYLVTSDYETARQRFIGRLNAARKDPALTAKQPTLTSFLEPLLTATDRKAELFGGLHFTTFGNDVLNVEHRERPLVRADVNAVRAAFTNLGYEEVESWIPRQGVSWLSDGVTVGVSFRLRKRAD